ncbi:MAG: response regulator [Planctomycetaceae bacterium]
MRLRMLLLEDEPLDAELIRDHLNNEGIDCELTRVSSRDDFERELSAGHGYSLVLSDFTVPQFDGLAALRWTRQKHPDLPFIFISGAVGEDRAIGFLREGATDYVLKHRIERLAPAVQRALRETEDRIQRRFAERQLQLVNELLEQRVAERTAEAERRAEQLRALAAELTRAEERERRRLAQTLHDHLQQLIVAAKLHLQSAGPELKNGRTREAIRRAQDMLDESIRASRSLTIALSPPVLYDAGLTAALEWLARRGQDDHGLEVRLELDSDAEPDSEEMRVFLFQAVRELLLNVATHAGVSEARLSLSAVEDWAACIVVEDDGHGFDSRAVLANAAAHDRFGLFSIGERLRWLGGRLDVETAPGRGTRVTLTAPRRPEQPSAPAAQTEAATANAAASPTRSARETPTVDGHKIRIVLADDHRIMRESLAGLLRMQSDMEVVGKAANGREAVELARDRRPDVVILDVTMPEMDGIEAARLIAGERPGTRIIGLSMHEKADMNAAMRDAGAAEYLTKDGPPELLLAAIRAGREEE